MQYASRQSDKRQFRRKSSDDILCLTLKGRRRNVKGESIWNGRFNEHEDCGMQWTSNVKAERERIHKEQETGREAAGDDPIAPGLHAIATGHI